MLRSLKRNIAGSVVSVLALGLAAQCASGSIILHQGANNPLTEGFAVIGDSSNGHVAVGASEPAWQIEDDTAARLTYTASLTETQRVALAGLPWTVTWRFEILSMSNPDPQHQSVEFNFTTRNTGDTEADRRRYTIRIGVGSGANSDDMVIKVKDRVEPGPNVEPTYTVLNKGIGTGFHTFQLTNPGGVNAATFTVDGDFIAVYSGQPDFGSADLLFGSLNDFATETTTSNWSLVEYAVPEPVGVALLGIPALAMVWRRRAADR